MKSASFGVAQDKRGFTLVELLVVIAIIAILSTVGVVVFRGVTSSARDAARKADVEAINKAFETHYTPGSGYDYALLPPSYFASGSIPTPPEGGNYFIASATDGSGVQVCSKLEGFPENGAQACNSSSFTCYCKPSVQSTSNPNANFNYFNSAGDVDNTSSNPSYVIGLGGGSSQSPLSCDPNQTLDDGLVGYWKLDEETGSTTIDSLGNGLNATLVGNPTRIPTSAISPSFINGVSFNGTSQQVTTPVSSLTRFIASAGYTISAWVYLDQYQPNGGTGGCCGSRIAYTNSDNGGFDWRIWNNGTLSFYRPTTWCVAYGNLKVPLNQWVNLVATYNNQQVYLYMNGNRIASKNTCDFLDSSAAIRFNYPGGSHGLYGDMDDLRVYNRALSPEEVSDLYSDGDGCIPQ